MSAETKRSKSTFIEIGPGKDVTIVRRDGPHFYGSIEKIEDDLVRQRLIAIRSEITAKRFLAGYHQPPLIAGTIEMSHPAETQLASPPVN